MNINTKGFYRTRGKSIPYKTSARIVYKYLKLNENGTYCIDIRFDEKDLDFVQFLENATEDEKQQLERGNFEIVGSRLLRFTLSGVHKPPDDPVMFCYTIEVNRGK